jgi:DNA-binding response OmpR family regulator
MQVRVLFVSPEARRVSNWCEMLRRRHYKIFLAHDSATARSAAAQGLPQLVVLDVADPKFNGLELCRQLRADRVNVPILIVNTGGTLDDILAGFDAGADAYLRGPIEGPELLAQIGVLSRRHIYRNLRPLENSTQLNTCTR